MVRSITTSSLMAGEIDACNCGSSARTRSTVSMMLAPGWRKMTISTAGLPLASPALRMSSTESCDVGHVAEANGRAVVCRRRSDGRYSIGFEQLIVGVDRPGVRCRLRIRPLACWHWRVQSAVRTCSSPMP